MSEKNYLIDLPDGRKLDIVEGGHSDGFTIIFHHGTPGSKLLFPPWISDAERRGIRLIGFSRAGYGGSSPLPDRTVANAAKDVAAIADHLQLEKIGVWGVSGGGPHALACAALLPDLVVAAAALASVALYPAEGLDWFDGMGQDNLDEFGAALEGREAVSAFIEGQTPGMLNADAKMLVQALQSLLCPPDVAVLNEETAGMLLKRIREGIEKRRDGWVDDDLAFTKPWGFDLDQIKIPILIMQGDQDQMVPKSHGRWLAEQIPHAETRFLPDDGHLTISANRVPEVHAWLLEKMSG